MNIDGLLVRGETIQLHSESKLYLDDNNAASFCLIFVKNFNFILLLYIKTKGWFKTRIKVLAERST